MKLIENLFIIMIKSNSFILECNIEYLGVICNKLCVYLSFEWKCRLEYNCLK